VRIRVLNCPRLLAVNQQCDPDGLIFAHHGRGSEQWSGDGLNQLDLAGVLSQLGMFDNSVEKWTKRALLTTTLFRNITSIVFR
jgi:hypothetical protein